MTPEGKVKKIITVYLTWLAEYLDKHGKSLHYSMFVPTGYGRNNTLDFTICLAGHFIAIEAKAPGEWLTSQQRITCRDILRSGGTVFIISGPEGMDSFARWVERNADRFLAD